MKLFSIFAALILFSIVGIAAAEVNINTASVSELAEGLKNIGPAKAAAIVEYRKMHGAFKTVDELASVQGIGETTLEMNREIIVLTNPELGVVSRSSVAGSE